MNGLRRQDLTGQTSFRLSGILSYGCKARSSDIICTDICGELEHGGTADYFPGGRTGLSTFRFSGGCDGKQHDGSVCVRTFVSASGDILLPVLS